MLIGALQPVLYLLLFGPLLEPIVSEFPGAADNPYTFLVPGLLVQLGMFGAFFAGFGLIGEWREGVIEAERVTPASRTALLVGRLLRDVAQLFVQAMILVFSQLAVVLLSGLDGNGTGLASALVDAAAAMVGTAAIMATLLFKIAAWRQLGSSSGT